MNCLIVDDEHHCRENLSDLLSTYTPEVEVIGMASSVKEAKTFLDSQKVEVLFLDIRMPGGDGFELLRQVDLTDCAVVFTTAHSDFAIRALKEGAFDYLEKPIDIQELEECVERIKSKPKNESAASPDWKTLMTLSNLRELDKTHIPTADGFIIVRSADIVRLEASESYTILLMSDGKRHISSKNIRVFEEILNPEMFLRVHKSHIVNMLYHLEGFTRRDGNSAIMSNGDHVPVSRRKLSLFLDRAQT